MKYWPSEYPRGGKPRGAEAAGGCPAVDAMVHESISCLQCLSVPRSHLLHWCSAAGLGQEIGTFWLLHVSPLLWACSDVTLARFPPGRMLAATGVCVASVLRRSRQRWHSMSPSLYSNGSTDRRDSDMTSLVTDSQATRERSDGPMKERDDDQVYRARHECFPNETAISVSDGREAGFPWLGTP